MTPPHLLTLAGGKRIHLQQCTASLFKKKKVTLRGWRNGLIA